MRTADYHEVISIGYDHAGYNLGHQLAEYLIEKGYKVNLYGPDSADNAVNYAQYCIAAAEDVSNRLAGFGIVIGGSAQGEQIAANKVFGIRAALCFDTHMARLARQTNDANILAIAGRMVAVEYAKEILDVWLATNFEGGRHADRIKDICDYENKQRKGAKITEV